MNIAMKKNMFLVRLSLTALLLLSVNVYMTAQKSFGKETLVTIAGEPTTADEFMRVYNKNNTQSSMQEITPIPDYLDLYINFKLKVKEAEDLQMDTIEAFQKELAGYRDQLAKPYFIDESVNEALLREAYERKLLDVRASHILIMVDENAPAADTMAAYNQIVDIRKEVMNGMDFSEAALKYSDDPSAKDREEIPGKQRFRPGNKGDLGYFTVFNMVYPFETAAYNTPVGEISKPVRTRFGYHIIKVTDKKDALGIAQVAHIFVAVPFNASPEDSAAKSDKINNIYQKIEEGMSFEEAVTEYSEDRGSANNGGLLTKFTCNRVVPEFVLAAQALEIDEVSAPVKTMYGYHILKLISRETPGTFEEEEATLKERLEKDNRTMKSKQAVINTIKAENNFKLNMKAKDELFAAIDTSVLNRSFSAATVESFDKTLIKLGNEKYSQSDFAAYVEKNQRKQVNLDKNVYLEQLLSNYIESICIAYEDAHLEEKYPDFAALMEEYHDGILLFNLTDEKVWSQAVKDTAGLEKFFHEHQDDYMWEERVDATLFTVRNKKDASLLRDLITRHLDDGAIAKALDEDSITSVTIQPGLYENGDNKYLDQVEWKAGTTTEYESDVEDLITIIRIREILPPEPKELNEARGVAIADYQTYLEKEWIRQLKEKYPVVVNEAVLEQLVSSQ
jgi:peptidyl-prolyl cis-trans isomerase SurA